jgi:two-component system chemotaxis response regulator CheB
LVAEDSTLIRRLLRQVIQEYPQLVVAREAENGLEVIRQFRECNADVILMDTEMPAMSGLDAVIAIRNQCQRVPIVMFGSPERDQGDLVLDAMCAGANDFCQKPEITRNAYESLAQLRRVLTPRLVMWGAAFRHEQAHSNASPGSRNFNQKPVLIPFRNEPGEDSLNGRSRVRTDHELNDDSKITIKMVGKSSVDVVVLAASTKDTDPLIQILMNLPSSFATPLLVTIDGMQASQTRFLVDRVSEFCKLPVRNAENGCLLSKGVSIAPGGQQLVVQHIDKSVRQFTKDIAPDAAPGFTAGVLFTSAAIAFGDRVLGVVLGGTEKHCVASCKIVRSKGGRLIIQTRQNSVKPKTMQAFSDPNLLTRCLPAEAIADAICDVLRVRQDDGTRHACIGELP